MPKRTPKGPQLPTILQPGDLFQASFDLEKQDQFVTSLGVQFNHYKAVPSPIGLKERGGYRRSEAIDTVSSNGFLYIKSGCFTATMVGNSDSMRRTDGGIADTSTARLIMPRFYDSNGSKQERIYLSPGDRLYLADPDADVLVSNFQLMQYDMDRDNQPMFPICKIEAIFDSLGNEFTENKDFVITKEGNIRWLQGGKNPGIDPDTKSGRVYSIRYLYKSFWYVIHLINEVRITNVTNGNIRKPERMSYFAVIQREYVYHNINNSKMPNIQNNKISDSGRKKIETSNNIDSNSKSIKVNMDDFE